MWLALHYQKNVVALLRRYCQFVLVVCGLCVRIFVRISGVWVNLAGLDCLLVSISQF